MNKLPLLVLVLGIPAADGASYYLAGQPVLFLPSSHYR
jgi:hypothetical protein